MNYVAVFDAAASSGRDFWPLASPVVLGVAGLYLCWEAFRGGARASQKAFALFFAAFSWSIATFLWTSIRSDQSALRRALADGRAPVVEGVVEDFVPMPRGGHALESFRVGGVRFAYSDYIMTAGFHRSAASGGPIHAGLPVRITYVPRGRANEIARLEVPIGTPLNAPERGRALFLLGPAALIVLVLGAGWARAAGRRNGDPIEGSVFHETLLSGRSYRSRWTRSGGASNCLEVYVTPESVVIRPIFLFDLAFLTGLYSLRQNIPRRAIIAVEKKDRLFMKSTIIRWRDEGGTEQAFELFVHKHDEFAAHLAPRPAA